MLARYEHPTEQRKVGALESFAEAMGRKRAESESDADAGKTGDAILLAILLGNIGGRDWTRTSDLPGVNGVL
jgi:hypothetical protein